MAEAAKRSKVVKTDEEWRKILTPEQYQVMRRHGTERPGSCALLTEHRAGTFSCVACDNPLFVADRSSKAVQGGRFFRRSKARSGCRSTTASSCGVSRSTAIAAAAISGMSSRMGFRRRPGSATASTAWRAEFVPAAAE